MKKLALFLLVAIGCHAQVPPATSHSVNLNWTAPAATSSWSGCTVAAPCVYAVYRCSASAATCANTSSTSWAEITTPSTRPSGTTYSDTTASGLTANYIVETFQGTANSAPSNSVTFTIPGVPIAPAINGSVAANAMPSLGVPAPTVQLASKEPFRPLYRKAWVIPGPMLKGTM